MNPFMQKLRSAFPTEPWKSLRQRGSILVLTAFALPVMIGGLGLAVDAGNIYLHKAQLQNAADAAAAGGAKVGMADAENDITKFDLDAANDKATNLIASNVTNGDSKDVTITKVAKPEDTWQYQSGKNNNIATSTIRYLKSNSKPETVRRYYTVQIEQDVPLMFLKYFLPYDSTPVHADAYARLGREEKTITITNTDTKKKSSFFQDLFIFENNIPEAPGILDDVSGNRTINTTFDGRVSYTGTSPKLNSNAYQGKTDPKDWYFFTSKVREGNLNANQAANEHNGTSFDDEGVDTANGYWTKAQHKDYNMTAFWNSDAVQNRITSSSTKHMTQDSDNTIKTSKAFSGTSTILYNLSEYSPNDNIKTPDNVTIDIDAPLGNDGDSDIDEPLFVILKESKNRHFQSLQLHVNADTKRPLIICFDPTYSESAHPSIKLEFTDRTFRGVVYVPTLDFETNFNRGTYKGSIIAKSITLRGQNYGDQYIYEALGDGGGGSSTTTTTTTTKTVLGDVVYNLSSDETDIANL